MPFAKNFFYKKCNLKYKKKTFLCFFLLPIICFPAYSENKSNNFHQKTQLSIINKNKSIKRTLKEIDLVDNTWNKDEKKGTKLIWKISPNDKSQENEFNELSISKEKDTYGKKNNKFNQYKINSLNRSIVFNDHIVGPDVGWIVPNGFQWNKKFKFDITARGHNTRIPPYPDRKFLGWNDGDAVGLISYQFLNQDKSSFGLNLGVRSLYSGNQAAGGSSAIGEGTSAGFRWDYKLSELSGIAFGAEQLIHFDSVTDTGRNIYLVASKAWWKEEYDGNNFFPLHVATAGLATGRMAVGTIKGFCSNLLGSSGTDIEVQPNLCWSPVFSIARLWNEKFSTYFEYNSRFFLAGSSYAPLKNIPVRGNLALMLSDHVDNYKLHNPGELSLVFNVSVGF